MGMPTLTYPRTTSVTKRLKMWREKADLSIDDLAYQVRHRLPQPEGVSRELIRRYESGSVPPERMSTIVLMAIARECHADFDELGEPFVSNAKTLKELVRTGSRCTGTSAAQSTAA